MDQYEHIRTAHRVYKKSIRQIARETGHTRKTVRKALQGLSPKYRRKGESGMWGDGLGRRGSREMAERRIRRKPRSRGTRHIGSIRD